MKKYLVPLTSAIGVAMGYIALAAADSDVTTTAATLATSIKENTVGVLTANIGILSIAGLVILGVLLVWRLGKRFIGGR